MAIITVTASEDRLTAIQRRELAESQNGAVLMPEVDQLVTAARNCFQNHFVAPSAI